MSYIDNNLMPNEQILFRTKKHPIIFLGPVFWLAATIFCYVNSNPMVQKLAFAPGIAFLATLAFYGLDYLTAEFAVTDKRIMMKEGFFFRHANELRIQTISNITVNQSLLAQVLGYGTIIINPFGGDNDVFREIDKPFEFQRHAHAQIEKISPSERPTLK